VVSTVEVWTTSSAARELDALLSDDERVRALAMRGEAHSARYVAAHALLRSLLAERTNIPPARIRIERRSCVRCGGPHGKPFCADDPSITFSLSHSGDMAAVAVASSLEVGLDIEDTSRKRGVARLAAKTLSDRERLFFEASGSEDACFFRLWTRKEAVLKATGAGITRRLSGVSIPPDESTVNFEGVWTLTDLSLPGRYVGTLAVEGSGAAVRQREWTP